MLSDLVSALVLVSLPREFEYIQTIFWRDLLRGSLCVCIWNFKQFPALGAKRYACCNMVACYRGHLGPWAGGKLLTSYGLFWPWGLESQKVQNRAEHESKRCFFLMSRSINGMGKSLDSPATCNRDTCLKNAQQSPNAAKNEHKLLMFLET